MSGPSLSAVLGLLYSQLTYSAPLPTTSFSGQTCIVTGANTGLGREVARHLVRLDAALVILAVRTPSKGEAAREYIEKETGRTGCMQVWELDMANFESVKKFAQRASELERLDVLVANAGVWPTKFELVEGHEATITVNVISTFLLTRLLIPKMQQTKSLHPDLTPRITILSSALHKFATLPSRKSPSIFQSLNQPLSPKDYDNRYYDSKLLVHLYGSHLASTLGSSVTLSFVNPGWCASALHPAGDFGTRLGEAIFQRSTEAGARIVTDAVVSGKEGRNGAYLDEMKVRSPAAWLKTKEGKETGERVWGEMNGILEGVEGTLRG